MSVMVLAMLKEFVSGMAMAMLSVPPSVRLSGTVSAMVSALPMGLLLVKG